MNKIIIVVVALALMGGGLALTQKKSVEYINQVETKEVTVAVDALEEQVKNALVASSTDIEAYAQKAYEDAKKQMEVEIELEVTSKYRAEIESKEKALQAQSVAY